MTTANPNPSYIEVRFSDFITKWEQLRSDKYWEYRQKWIKNAKEQIVENFPLHLDIEVSRRCNLRCPMCPRTLKIERGEKLNEGDMSMSLYRKVIDEGSREGLCSIKLSYLGEPLIHKELPEMIKYAKDKGIVDIMFNTNGVLLTEDVSQKLISAGLDKLFVSFDSPNPETYEKIRVGTTFDRVFNNVKNLLKIREKMNSINPVIRVSMTVMQENKAEVLDYIKLWHGIADLIGFGDYINP
jgi:MoaA/NifB/PqqE/SkfB family radical SAM enzyme